MTSNQPPPYDPKEDAAKYAFVGIDKNHPLWRDLNNNVIPFMLDCFKSPSGESPSGDIAGFAQIPAYKPSQPLADKPSLWATQMVLKSFWWAQDELQTEAINHFHQRYGTEGMGRLKRFLAACYSKENGYGGFKGSPLEDRIDLEHTQWGLDSLISLSEMWGEKDTFPYFKKKAGDNAFVDISNFIRACWHEEERDGKKVGAYSSRPDEPIALWPAYSALITYHMLIPDHLGAEESEKVVSEVWQNTPLIIEFLKSFNGKFGFAVGSVPNLYSIERALGLGNLLYLFNGGDPEDIEAHKKFIGQFADPDKLTNVISTFFDRETGLAVGYPPITRKR